MKYVLQLLFLVHCALLQGVLEWTVVEKVTDYGQNVTLFCNVSNCCPLYAGWDRWTPKQRTLFIDVKTGRPNTKYDGKVIEGGYTLIIQNLTKNDLNVSYSCLYGATFGERKFLLEEDAFTYISSTQPNVLPGKSKFSEGELAALITCMVALVSVPIFVYVWRRRKNGKTENRKRKRGSEAELEQFIDQVEQLHDGISTETCNGVSRKENMINMLKRLKLEEFCPSKISLPMVYAIIKKSTDVEVTEESIPWLLLRKFMTLNYKGREEDLNTLYKCHEDEDVDDMSDKNIIRLHPLDVFLLTFLCCDPILQQELVSKMFFCRLAVPFIYRTLEDKLIMSKWAFRKIVINRKRDGEWVGEDALSQDIKIVTFLRIGPVTHETVSKSNIINEVLSNQKHPTFLNKKACISFETEKLITIGMVEASWFIPSNSDSENVFQDVVMFLNMRGDCLHYEEEVRTVSSISDVVIVLINVNSLDESKVVQNLEKIHSFDKCIIYGIESRNEEIEDIPKVKSFQKQFMLKKENTIRVGGEINFTIAQLFQGEIRKSLMNSKAKKFAKVISGINFGDDHFSIEGYTMSKDISDFINKQPDERKIFPLQGSVWKELCMCTKKLFRSKSEDEQVELRINKNKLEQKQFDLIDNSEILQRFTRNMLSIAKLKESYNEIQFFIAWMKTFMDERSRSNQNYNQKPLSFKLTNCYDHFIREMGLSFSIQVQDTLARKNTYIKEVSTFQKFVSNMLQFGFPFELMDGDTGMVPLVWVEAVFRQLKEDIGEQNVYVISVLGIQSSGKSTLLNTMFGLHFAVSAGRCTRGVFMQLIRVTDDTLPFNYLLILDTEGIRASLNDQKRSVFENELATFAIGLGNITILNIKGENITEIENVLQIAVHACLRLKMVNKNLKMQPRCVFVHQNVDANDADVRLKKERDKLMHRLDEMVIEAAKSEDRSDIMSFNQVIGINAEKDIWYFPDLWQGQPPMATVNLGYSTMVSRLKTHILHNIAKTHGTSYTIQETLSRITDFCRGILMDDFVFSFRNSLEIKVYREMNAHFQTLTWKHELKIDNWISTTVSAKIAGCTEDELESVCKTFSEQLEKTFTDRFSLIKEKFRHFIDNNKFKNLMDQYKGSRILQLDEWNKLLQTKRQNEIQRLRKRHKSFLYQMSKMKKHKTDLKQKALDLVAECKTAELSEEDTIKHFTIMWNEWLKGIDSTKDVSLSSADMIEKIIEKRLFEMFISETPLLHDQTKIYNREKYRTMKALHNSFESNQLHEDHITSKLPIGVDQTSSLVFLDLKKYALNTINLIMQNIDNYISLLHNDHVQFKESHATSVFMYLKDGLDKHNSSSYFFSLTTKLRAKLAVHVKMYIVEDFTNLNNKWQEKNDMKTKIHSEKQTYLDYFISIVKEQTMKMRMANLFLSKIKQFITETVSEKLPIDVYKSIYPDTFNTKYSLMVEIMTDLVQKSDFEEFKQYIDDSREYALNWLAKYINNKLFTCNEHGNEYTQLAEKHITRISERIMESIEYATTYGSKEQDISLWYTSFEKKLNKSIPVPNGIFLIDIGEEKVDVYNYKQIIVDKFENAVGSIKELFKNQNAESVKWTSSPYINVFDKLWGCTATCPFCKEACQKRAQHSNEQHSCIQHRPPAVCGIRKASTGTISLMNCNSLVYSKETFLCSAVSDLECKPDGKCERQCKLPYKDYKKVLPGWIIEPSPLNEDSPYWSWFISYFQSELCKLYKYKTSKIKTISKGDAINSLFSR